MKKLIFSTIISIIIKLLLRCVYHRVMDHIVIQIDEQIIAQYRILCSILKIE